jgi:NADH:ubiquinone oxidoreductase subunit 5 (subunit L)/multisubunit Na+/H+ antiporter MnhA subunit
MFSFILYFPLIFSVIVGFCGRLFGTIGGRFLSNVGLFMNFISTIILWFVVFMQQFMFYSQLINWVFLPGLLIEWVFCFDSLSAAMFLVVNSVSCVVHFFSAGYMSSDPHVVRFMSYISFFTLFMLILVSGDNLVQVFLGWEGVGLCSYLLISFWYTRVDAISSGLKALIVNRISDFLFLCALFFLSFVFCSLDFSIVLAVLDLFVFNMFLISYSFFINGLLLCCVLLIGGAMGKSAQILLHT